MKNKLRFPSNIQCFAEGGNGDGAGDSSGAAGVASQTTTAPQIDYEKLAGVVSKRAAGTEDKVLQGYFKQQGLTSEQAIEAINQYKLAQTTKQQEEAQRIQKMQQENEQLKAQIQNSMIDQTMTTLAQSEGVAAEKLPFVLKLIERKDLMGKDGKIADDKAKAALKTVLDAFPDFKGSTSASGVHPLVGGTGGSGAQGSATDAQLDAIFGISKQ